MGEGREEGLCLDPGFLGDTASLLQSIHLYLEVLGDPGKSFSVDQKLHAFKKWRL